jgi:hypothetical protein
MKTTKEIMKDENLTQEEFDNLAGSDIELLSMTDYERQIDNDELNSLLNNLPELH